MTTGRRALVVLAVSLAIPGARLPAAAEPSPARGCVPAARVGGDPELAHRVSLELAVLGIRTEEIAPSCPAVEVTLDRSGEHVSVALRDPAGRRAQQLVTNAHVAATWIESWLHPEIRAPLLAARSGAVFAPAALDLRVDEAARAPVPSMAFRGFILTAAGEKVYGSDDSEWRSLSLSACARWGGLCPGLVTRLADNRDFAVDELGTAFDRLALDLMASMSTPFAIGRMQLAPTFAVGVGYLRSASSACGEGENVDPATGCRTEPAVSSTLGPRGEMGLYAAFPIASHVSLVLVSSLSFAPMARGPLPGVPSPGPDGTIPDPDRNGNEPGDNGDLAEPARPGEPDQFTRIGVGLAVELP
jgi:hypothetical protein